MIIPVINYLQEIYGITCAQYVNEKKYSELLGLQFTNPNTNTQCSVYISNIFGKIKMSFRGAQNEPFDVKKLIEKIVEKLY